MKWDSIKKGDIILMGVLGIIAIAALLILNFTPTENPNLKVYLPDGTLQNYSLSKIEGQRDIKVAENVIIRLENGRACFISSDCHDKICINSGWLDSNGDYAACLPNGIAMCITDGNDGEVDVIV